MSEWQRQEYSPLSGRVLLLNGVLVIFLSKDVHFTPFNFTDQTSKLLDWSVSSPEHEYTIQLRQYRYAKGDASLPTFPANAWHAPGWVSPTFHPAFNSQLFPIQSDLYHLFAATHKVTLIRPRSEIERISASVLAGVAVPFSILSSEDHGDFSLVFLSPSDLCLRSQAQKLKPHLPLFCHTGYRHLY